MKNDLTLRQAIFLRAAELVESGHCKGALARDINGRAEFPGSGRAVRWCLDGALTRASLEFCQWDEDCAPSFDDINFNDAPSTTPAMVAERLRARAWE